ncbi:ubiquitin-specific protease ubp2 [Rhizina undulata]
MASSSRLKRDGYIPAAEEMDIDKETELETEQMGGIPKSHWNAREYAHARAPSPGYEDDFFSCELKVLPIYSVDFDTPNGAVKRDDIPEPMEPRIKALCGPVLRDMGDAPMDLKAALSTLGIQDSYDKALSDDSVIAVFVLRVGFISLLAWCMDANLTQEKNTPVKPQDLRSALKAIGEARGSGKIKEFLQTANDFPNQRAEGVSGGENQQPRVVAALTITDLIVKEPATLQQPRTAPSETRRIPGLDARHDRFPVHHPQPLSPPFPAVPRNPVPIPENLIAVNIFLTAKSAPPTHPSQVLRPAAVTLTTTYARMIVPSYTPVRDLVVTSCGTNLLDGLQEVFFLAMPNGAVAVRYGNIYRTFHGMTLEEIGWAGWKDGGGVRRLWKGGEKMPMVWVRIVQAWEKAE